MKALVAMLIAGFLAIKAILGILDGVMDSPDGTRVQTIEAAAHE